MRIIVCGGRDFADADGLQAVLTWLHAKRRVTAVIHGGAKGADALAASWAKVAGIEVVAFPADWNAHGKAAGPIRNRRMLAEGNPDGVVAFPGGRGTEDMVKAAEEVGVKVWFPRLTKQVG